MPQQMMALLTNLTEHVGRLDRQLQEQRQLPEGLRLPPGARVFQFQTEPGPGLPADVPPVPPAEPEEPAAQPVLPEAARLYQPISPEIFERLPITEAARYLRDPAIEAQFAITRMPLKPKAGSLFLFSGTGISSERWRADGYR